MNSDASPHARTRVSTDPPEKLTGTPSSKLTGSEAVWIAAAAGLRQCSNPPRCRSRKAKCTRILRGDGVMIMADVWKILFLILGSQAVMVSYWLLAAALF